MNSKRAMAQLLKHLSAVGVTHVPKVDLPKPAKSTAAGGAVKRTAAKGPPESSSPQSVAESTRRPLKSATEAVEPKRSMASLLSPEAIQSGTAVRPSGLADVQQILNRRPNGAAEKTEALCTLAKSVAGCNRCPELATRRTQTVFGVGNPEARIMLIGEAPGADEDARGEPFVGPAGQLLDKIIVACRLRREDLYICNILRCRPPGNRNPLPQEAANCREFLDAQIHVVQPEYIICLGTVAAQNLLNQTLPVGKLRGKFFDYQGIRVMCTYHPSYLLRNPSAKKQVWDDMKFFMKDLGVELQ